MKRKNTGYEDGKYSLPGGHVEQNEEIRKANIPKNTIDFITEILKDNDNLYIPYNWD